MFPLLFSSVAPFPHTHHTISHCCHGVCTGSAAWWCTHLLRCGVREREEEREGKCCDEEEMERTSRWKVDQCGTACALHPHPAAHDMPARCAVGDDHLTGLLCSALHGCSAWLLCFLPPCSPSPPHDMVVVKRRRRGRGRRGSHVPQERSAHKCVHPHALDAEWWMQQDVAHTHTHMQLAGTPPSTPQHEEGVRRQTW